MCWRDDERDWAGEAARERLDQDRRTRDAKGIAWALTATTAQKRATRAEELLMLLLNLVTEDSLILGTGVKILHSKKLHLHFPSFAQAIGLRGPFYRLRKDGKCPAITFAHMLSGYDNDTSLVHFITGVYNAPETRNKAMAIADELGLKMSIHELEKAAKEFLKATRKPHPAEV